MIIFELISDDGDSREVFWTGSTYITGPDQEETDNIYEQLTAHECFLDA